MHLLSGEAVAQAVLQPITSAAQATGVVIPPPPGDPTWKDEVMAQMTALREEVAGLKERLTVLEDVLK
jgi:hypothetical protein